MVCRAFLFYSAALIFDMLNAETLPSGETVALILKWLVLQEHLYSHRPYRWRKQMDAL